MKHIITLLICFGSIANVANVTAQTQVKVYIIRHSMYGGLNGGFSVYADDSLICNNLNNNKHLERLFKPGIHTFTAQFGGKQLKKGAKKEEISVEMESGKSYYVSLVYQVKHLIGNLYVQEITESSAKKILAESIKDTDCN